MRKFLRPVGQESSDCGLGLSIINNIVQLYELKVNLHNIKSKENKQIGFKVVLY